MINLLYFGLLGLGVGALYVLGAQGMVLIYRGSGVLNLAQGAIGISGAYLEWELVANHGQSFLVGAVAGIAFAALIGVLMQNIVMRRLRHATPVIRLVSTLGLLVSLTAVASLRYGDTTTLVKSVLPTDVWNLGHGLAITSDRMYLLMMAVGGTAILWAVYRYTRFGRSTSAVAENQRAAATLGVSPDVVATINWGVGCALAALAAILLVPIETLSVNDMSSLLLPVVAAALVGGFTSFPLTCVAGLAIGVLQTELQYENYFAGLAESVPFIVIVVVLALRGRSLPLRDHLLQRLPAAGSGNIKLWRVVVLTVVGCVIADQVPQLWSSAIAQSMAGALILLSIVLLTGYAGQISLAQVATAGFGAWIAARMAADQGAPFLLALIIGIVATVPLAVLFGLTAIRTRGPNLAIATLGLGAAIEYIILDNTNLTGGVFGLTVPTPKLFGYSIDPIAHTSRYAIVCIVAFAIAAVAVANLRRGRTGRRMLAVRENERAAAALGISVPGTKIYAFAVSTAIAATGGVLIAFQNPVVSFTSFTSTMSISFVGFAVIGGVGYISGAIAGSSLVVGGVGTQLGNEIFNANGSGSFSQYLPIISGLSLLAILMQDPDGIAAINIKQAKFLAAKARARGVRLPSWAHVTQRHSEPETQPTSVAKGFAELRKPSTTLEVKNLVVRYGGVTAVDDFSVLVEPGKVVGLIGPNGAGKTSVIDALTGFTPHASGHTTLSGVGIERLPAHRRARMGLSRSFQSLELFDDLTVAENLMTASDRRDYRAYITDFVHPAGRSFPPVVAAVIEEFRLTDVLGQCAGDLSHGERRLVAIARAIALEPEVILLDEPAAGLTDGESRELARVVRRLADEWGLAVLLVEHDVNFVMTISDHIVVLDFGRIICEGPPELVRSDEAVIAAYLGGAELDDPSSAAPATDPVHVKEHR